MVDSLINVEISEEFDPQIPKILPHERIYSIQVGYKLFKLSGASLSSDAPSYFSRFFLQEGNNDKVLFIDRNPLIFEKIYQHLQGYQISVDNEYEFVHLLLDCYYFGLKRLQRILKDEDIFATIGNRPFKISKSLLVNSGNYPNFFSVSYESMLTDNSKIIEQRNIIRPPPQKPATVNSRSPELFNDLLEFLRGNSLVIKNDEHRNLLMKECKYYRFLELEQRIIKHKVINNPFNSFTNQEIIIGLNDLNAKGIIRDPSIKDANGDYPIQYQRPFILKEPKRTLIMQLDSDFSELSNRNFSEIKLILVKKFNIVMVQLTNSLCQKFLLLFRHTESFLIEDLESGTPSICIITEIGNCKTVMNGMEMKKTWVSEILDNISSSSKSQELIEDSLSTKKRKLSNEIKGDKIEFKLTKSLWKLILTGTKLRLQGVSIEGVTDSKSFDEHNMEFL
ncbi:uncharacterized protein AC631_01441 [Debaryomyces fabryi]|uniref:BTB domain-containing protein n=1 Tax=Debaryomyces fabryi TaxID=58627 RepID=A0A0V1Q351_9ASCO|nr:uncharacterized protein AC631_01441 [Debaryomyces fabryi]KSA02844.1 hypothetical protein AC631_01441 [Debaryomyces fabryi]CUM46137.1 unnamed protein product [Debaryomyces fabryi]